MGGDERGEVGEEGVRVRGAVRLVAVAWSEKWSGKVISDGPSFMFVASTRLTIIAQGGGSCHNIFFSLGQHR